MNVHSIVPLLLGALAVVQAGLNRRILEQWGLPAAVLLNTLVLLVIAAGLWLWTRLDPSGLDLGGQPSLARWRWWFVVPGMCGFLLVAGTPWTLRKLGALQVFVGIVAAQLVVSLVWDAMVEGIAVSPTRIGGAVLAVLGAVLVSWR